MSKKSREERRRRRREMGELLVQRKCTYCQEFTKVPWDDLEELEQKGIVCEKCVRDLKTAPSETGSKMFLFLRWPKRLRPRIEGEEISEETIPLTVTPPIPVVIDQSFMGV